MNRCLTAVSTYCKFFFLPRHTVDDSNKDPIHREFLARASFIRAAVPYYVGFSVESVSTPREGALGCTLLTRHRKWYILIPLDRMGCILIDIMGSHEHIF